MGGGGLEGRWESLRAAGTVSSSWTSGAGPTGSVLGGLGRGVCGFASLPPLFFTYTKANLIDRGRIENLH